MEYISRHFVASAPQICNNHLCVSNLSLIKVSEIKTTTITFNMMEIDVMVNMGVG